MACRGLRRARSFTAAAVFTLTIGIASTTVMFALIEAVLLRPLPVRDQDRLIVAWKELRSTGFAHYPFGGPDVDAVAGMGHLMAATAGVTSNGASPWIAVDNGHASYVNGALVTGGFFEVLGVEPILGRSFTPADDVEGADNVVVISYALWHRQYAGSPDALGRRIDLGGLRFTVVGVTGPGFAYPQGTELWRTVRSVKVEGPFGEAARYEVDLIARLRPGVTIDQARGELQAVTARLASRAPPDYPRSLVPVVRSLEDVVIGDTRTTLLLLFAAVGFVLVIASANAANLLLMRSEGRQKELVVRAALGAGRSRIVSQVLAESGVLALIAGVASLFLSWISLSTLITLIPPGVPRIESVRIDTIVMLFTLGTALFTALLAGLVPALASVRTNLVGSLRSSAGEASPFKGRRTLVAAQVALTVVIVAAAGLLVRSLSRLQSADMGFSADHLVFVDLALPPAKVMDRTRHEQFLEELMAGLTGAPDIAAATPVNVLPFSGNGGWDVPRFTAQGQSPDRAATNPALNLESVHPTYFGTFGIPIVRGRAFTKVDRAGAPLVAIVSTDVAARTWPGEDPIGKRLKMGGPGSEEEWRSVVGIAAPTRYRELATPRATLYLPASQFLMTARTMVVRSTSPLDVVGRIVRNQVSHIDREAQVIRVAPFAVTMDVPLAKPRVRALLLGIFGVSAFVLSTIGLYAVIASNVRQRRREIGIRIALGASARNVRRLVLNDALRLSAVGTAIGLIGAMGATRLIRSILFEVDPLDPATLVATALALIAASLLAAYIPMRRATRLDPAMMLRAE
jgi:predicted permease